MSTDLGRFAVHDPGCPDSSIIAVKLNMPLHVEFDLHEWLPDLTNSYDNVNFVVQQQKELDEYDGEWPDGVSRTWEPLSHVRQRVLAVLQNYQADKAVIIVCHGTVIYALTGLKVAYGEIVPYTLNI